MFIVQFLLFLLAAFLAYKAVFIFWDMQASRKYVYKKFLQKRNQDFLLKKESSSTNTSSIFGKYMSYRKYIESTQQLLNIHHVNQSASLFLLKRFGGAIFVVLFFLVMYVITKFSLYLVIAIPLAFFVFQLPIKQVKKYKSYYEQQLRIEIIHYISFFLQLITTQTPYVAAKKSEKYAGDIIRPNVEQLVIEMEMYPQSDQPFQKFANDVNVREARVFMNALNQIRQVNAVAASRIIQEQVKIMDELQEETYKELIESRPDEVEKYIGPMIFPYLAVVFTFLIVMIADSFSAL